MNIIPYAGKEAGARPEWGGCHLNTPGALAAAAARAEKRDATIMSLWREGFDTFDIANKLSWPESLVANSLARSRDAEKSR